MEYDGQDYRKLNRFFTVSSIQSSLVLAGDISYLELGRSIADVKRNILSFLLLLESDKNQMYFFSAKSISHHMHSDFIVVSHIEGKAATSMTYSVVNELRTHFQQYGSVKVTTMVLIN